MADVSVVVVTYNALPWIERCLESVRGHETIVVDHGSTDGTLELVRRALPEARLIEQENTGLGAGSNARHARRLGRLLPAAQLRRVGAWTTRVERLVELADEHPGGRGRGPEAANPDGSLQRSVRGFPTRWRLATEYFFLRKVAPRTRALNAVLRGAASTTTRCARPSS